MCLVSGLANEAELEQEISKRIGFEDIFNSSFSVKRTNLVWVGNGNKSKFGYLFSKCQLITISQIDPRDGIFTYRDPTSNDILLESIEDRNSQVFVQEKDLVCKFYTCKY